MTLPLDNIATLPILQIDKETVMVTIHRPFYFNFLSYFIYHRRIIKKYCSIFRVWILQVSALCCLPM